MTAAALAAGAVSQPRVPATTGCALAALRSRYPAAAAEDLAETARRAVDAIVRHPVHAGQVAAVATILRQAHLDAPCPGADPPSPATDPARARCDADAVVAAVTGLPVDGKS